MKTLAIIPARSGSKGIPNKNFRDFAGQSLVERAFDVANEACDAVLVSTDEAGMARLSGITARVRHYGAVTRRPDHLATDLAPMLPVVQHAVDVLRGTSWFKAEAPAAIVLLQPTSPLRKPEHVRAALKLLEETSADSVVSVVEIPAHFSPDYALQTANNYDPKAPAMSRVLLPWNHFDPRFGRRLDGMVTCRQDARRAVARDGTVYAIRRETIEAGSLYGANCVPLIIPPNESANIDTEEDWRRAETLFHGTR